MKKKDAVSLELETIANRLHTMKNGIQNGAYTQPLLLREITHVGGNTKRTLKLITDSNDVYYRERLEQNLNMILSKMKVLLDATNAQKGTAQNYLAEIDSIIRLVEFVSDTVSLENRDAI